MKETIYSAVLISWHSFDIACRPLDWLPCVVIVSSKGMPYRLIGSMAFAYITSVMVASTMVLGDAFMMCPVDEEDLARVRLSI